MPVLGMSSVWYPVANWERAKEFYVNVVGLRLEACSDEQGWASLRAGESVVPFFLVRRDPIEGPGHGAVAGFDATEVPAILERAREFGGKIGDHVQEGPSVRIHTLYDPDGNAIELSESTPSD